MIWVFSTTWLLILFIVLLWFPQNIHHEGMHALAAKFYGAKEVKLYPFPEWSDSWFPDYFAYMTYRFEYGDEPTDRSRALISGAPQIANTLWLMILLPILAYVSMPLWLYTFVSAFIVVQFIDAAVNLSSIFRKIPRANQDTWNLVKYAKINPWVMRVIVLVWYILFGFFIFMEKSWWIIYLLLS